MFLPQQRRRVPLLPELSLHSRHLHRETKWLIPLPDFDPNLDERFTNGQGYHASQVGNSSFTAWFKHRGSSCLCCPTPSPDDTSNCHPCSSGESGHRVGSTLSFCTACLSLQSSAPGFDIVGRKRPPPPQV